MFVHADNQQKQLQRGKIRMTDDPFLPGEDSIIMALAANDNNDNDGFRKRLEGFVDLCPGQQCIIRNPQEEDTPHNNLHNAVHIFLGGYVIFDRSHMTVCNVQACCCCWQDSLKAYITWL